MDSGGLLIETGVRILSFVVLLSNKLEQVHMLDGFMDSIETGVRILSLATLVFNKRKKPLYW